MSTRTIRIPIKAWYGDEEMELNFPEGWDLHECLMAGHDTPGLSDDQIREALDHPLGTKPLREIASGKKTGRHPVRRFHTPGAYLENPSVYSR